MDSDTGKIPGLELPSPADEVGQRTTVAPVHRAEGTHEVMMPAVEIEPSTSPSASPPYMSTPQAPLVKLPADNAKPLVAGTSAAPASDGAADDTSSDHLDVEWVNKAKAIVEQTRSDPHRESSELGKVKADYMRIRYNKNIKIVEEQSR